MTNLYIPKTIKVGFSKREDTYTGKLAFVVYFDEKGVLRQEKSWNGWRDHGIEPLEFENSPRANYIFNKGVKRDGYWGSGRSLIRVYDPRDFEFEISIDNLVGILMHSDVSKRDIVEECVFAWSGKDLVLLPVSSEEYRMSVEYTQKQSQTVSSKSLVPGYSYSPKKGTVALTYIGYYPWYEWENSGKQVLVGKKHVFHNGKYFIPCDASKLAQVISNTVDPNYANLVEDFLNSQYYKKFVDYKVSSDISIRKVKYSNYRDFNREYDSDYFYYDCFKQVGSKMLYVAFSAVDRQLHQINFQFVDIETADSFSIIKKEGYMEDLSFYQEFVSVLKELGIEIEKIKETAYSYGGFNGNCWVRLGYKNTTINLEVILEGLRKLNFGNLILIRDDHKEINYSDLIVKL